MKDVERRFVGIDLAKRSYVAKVLRSGTDKGRILKGSTSPEGLKRLCHSLIPQDRVSLEACAQGFWLARRLIERVGCEVVVLNAGDLAIIYRSTKKTDLNDAEKLAWLIKRLPLNELPVVALPTEEEESRRSMVSELHFKKRLRTMHINRLHSVFTRVGQTEIRKKHLATIEARKESIQSLTGRAHREALRLLEVICMMENHIQLIEEEMAVSLSGDELSEHLLSMPGVGLQTAMAFLAHVGDGSRFSKGRQVSNYVGMTPRIYSSGETERMGHISKHGCLALRSIIVQSAWSAVHTRRTNVFKTKYEELVPRIGKKRAIVAIARRMLETMWILVTRKEHFRGYDELSKRLKLRRIQIKVERLKKTGLVA